MKVTASPLLRAGAAATVATLSATTALAQTIAEINGAAYLSPYDGQAVNVSGLVTARGSNGFWIRSQEPDDDARTSESIFVYGYDLGDFFAAGDIVTLGGTVTEYRSSSDYTYLVEINDAHDIEVVSSGHDVVPVQIGGRKGRKSPPTQAFSGLDDGDVLGVPNAAADISAVNPELQPEKYAMDYWESLMGELVTIKNPRAVAKPNQYGDTWVVGGDWKVTGLNKRGGLTMRAGDSNPEAIVIGTPLDGTSNRDDGRLGDELADITGVVYQAYGFYRILPTTALKVIEAPQPAQPKPSPYTLHGSCAALTVGSYNIENFWPGSEELSGRVDHIVTYMGSPDLIFLQEVQDGDGPTDSGETSAEASLNALIDAVAAVTGWRYEFVDIAPVDGADGGQPGGNIRSPYLYNPKVLELKTYAEPGNATQAVEVLPGPKLSLNPGRIAPENEAWDNSRKPLVAHWGFKNSLLCRWSDLFTVNVHFGSKGGSSTLHGDPRPPINNGVDKRGEQAELTARFIREILARDRDAAVVASGDFNEFAFVRPLEDFVSLSGMVDLDEAARIPETERYTYIYDMNCQQLDHMYVSPKIARRWPVYQHIHVNTWLSYDDAVSDHDPSVARFNVL